MKLDSTSTTPLRTGREIPIIGFGTWSVYNPEVVRSAIELGYMLIDTSGDYGTQPAVGKGVRASGVPREDIYITTKVEADDDGYVAAQDNAAELGLPYVDLTLIHWPPQTGVGEQLWGLLRQAKQDGLTTDIGVSNYSVKQIQQLVDMTGEVPVVNQIEWSPFGHDMEMLEFCRANDIVIQAYSPLTKGKRLNDRTLLQMALDHGKTPGQVLIRWNLQLGTIPIMRAKSREHQQENIDVFDFELSDQDMADLGSLNELFSTLGSLSYAQH